MTFDMATFPRFSEFPNELKLQIIETTNPEDIVNLALSCKAVFILATETLAQHRYDKAHGSFLSFSVKWALMLYPLIKEPSGHTSAWV